jgi:phospholipid/cholesterol/gamma-HCH transport system substrate-binding protein
MNFKFRHTDKLVGAFLLIALLLLIAVGAALSVKQKMFVKPFVFHSQFNDAVGLSIDTPLIFKGFEIGKLKKFSLNRENKIDVEFLIYKEYLGKILVHSAISKSVNPVTGKSALEFLQGQDSTERISVGGFIPSMDSPEGRKLLAEGKIQRRSDAVFSIINNLDSILAEIERDYTTPEGALFRFKNSLAEMTRKMDLSAGQLNILLAALQTDHNADDGALFRALVNAADLTEQLKVTNRRVDTLLISAQQIAKVYGTPDSLLVRLIDPSGENLIGPTRSTLVNLNSNLTEMSKILEVLYAQTPQLSSLISRSAVLIQEAQKTVEALNNNPILRGGIQKDKPVEDNGSKIRETEVKP